MPSLIPLLLLGLSTWTGPTGDEASLRASWERLNAQQRKEVCELFELECRKLPAPQARTIYWLLDNEPTDRGYWNPESKAPLYAAAEHAPAYILERIPLPEDDPRLEEQRALLTPEVSPRQLRSAFRYDWALGTVVRTGDPLDPEYIFENALNGYFPGQDLARAIALKDLDDGSERKGLAAFNHTYAWNEGEVFEGITLYDAFLHGRDVDLSDVDALGLLHDTLGDWETWVSPIADQDGLYAVLSAEFKPIRQFRELRESVVDALLQGRSIRRNAYHMRQLQFHALWIQVEFDPKAMAKLLPTRAEHEARLEEWSKLSVQNVPLYSQAQDRVRRFDKDLRYIERVLARQMARVEAQGE